MPRQICVTAGPVSCSMPADTKYWFSSYYPKLEKACLERADVVFGEGWRETGAKRRRCSDSTRINVGKLWLDYREYADGLSLTVLRDIRGKNLVMDDPRPGVAKGGSDF